MVNLPTDIENVPEEAGFMTYQDIIQEIRSHQVEFQHLETFTKMVTHFCSEKDRWNHLVYQSTMDKLRKRFNLEFKMRCSRCGKLHYQDEISAPER